MRWLLVVALPALAACTPATNVACAPPLQPALEIDLYFGRDRAAGGEVSEAEWLAFLAESVTPRFPDGLSVLDVEGQLRDGAGQIVRERSKLLIVVVFDAPAHQGKVRSIVDAYAKRFGQSAVFRVEHGVCAAADHPLVGAGGEPNPR
ncbi:MAG: DUF3574 domain-containing protein [Alphaproteobacteria bacterium]|nr:DUF3574 domain-containing protein [Alphaproteobacteria bacterium]